MRRILCIVALIACFAVLSSCSMATPPEETTPASTSPPVTQMPTTAPAPTQPPHSGLYIPGLSVDAVIEYFSEVCLQAEFNNSGDPSKLQKWVEPISYTLSGEYTSEDLQVLSQFTEWLNTVEGFPGIAETQNPEQTNLQIFFTDAGGLTDLMGEQFMDCDGAVTFWYEEDEIYTANICYRTDIEQYIRNSVILEELYNGLGPIQDTSLREDSIIYANYSEPQQLTEIDELILRLLYHPDMKCGMDAAECEAVIRKLYY